MKTLILILSLLILTLLGLRGKYEGLCFYLGLVVGQEALEYL